MFKTYSVSTVLPVESLALLLLDASQPEAFNDIKIAMKTYFVKIYLTVIGACLLIFSSCIPARLHEDVKARMEQCEELSLKLKSENLDLSTKNSELLLNETELNRRLKVLKEDTLTGGRNYRRLNKLYSDLTVSYEKLIDNNDKLMASSESETRKVIGELQMTQKELQEKEDRLSDLEESLETKENHLKHLSEELKLREGKVNELQKILEEKDAAVIDLKNKVNAALFDFKDSGLSVEQKNGKVYVSLEERLLFESGSKKIDSKGQDALLKLAGVLKDNKDIDVLIEGHTDNVPIKSSASMEDNWDLSVLRATAVTRILVEKGGLEPTRVVPAGRGEYIPVDPANSVEAKKKNRRIEVILTPKLDELMKAIGN